MDTRSTLDEALQAARPAIVDAWFRALAPTSFSPRPARAVRARLNELANLVLESVLSEPPRPKAAAAVGQALIDLHYMSPRALESTLLIFGRDLLGRLPAESSVALQPTIVELLAAIASGFYAGGRDEILREQDEVRAALFVTRQKAEAADEARALAEATAKARSELLGRVAHDLRSPLTSIKGQADLMAQRIERDLPSADWLRSRINSIRNASDRMQGMIGELLDAARLEVGEELELDLRDTDAVDLVARVVQRMQATGRELHLELPDDPVVLHIDRARFERVLENLINNAVKYSPAEAQVDLAIYSNDGGQHTCITVRDRGYGIPADELSRVTTPFYRASTARGIPGVGLGLSGVKAIVEQHGGKLDIASVVGEGTEVTICLPSPPSQPEATGS